MREILPAEYLLSQWLAPGSHRGSHIILFGAAVALDGAKPNLTFCLSLWPPTSCILVSNGLAGASGRVAGIPFLPGRKILARSSWW